MTLEALEGTSCLFLCALNRISNQDDALAQVNCAVLLALSLATILNMRNDRLIPLGEESDFLEAIECAGSFLLEAGLHIKGLNEALPSVNGTVLLGHLRFIALDCWSVVSVVRAMLMTLNDKILEAIEQSSIFPCRIKHFP